MREGPGEPRGLGVPHLWAFSLRPHTSLSWTQGVVIGTGEKSQFGEVFKMMQAEEVRDWGFGFLSSFLDYCLFMAALGVHCCV